MTKPSVKIFGREPAAIIGLLEAVLASLLAFGLLGWAGLDSAEAVGTVMALVSALLGSYVAYVTRDAVLGYVLAAVKAGIALAAVYGLELTMEQAGAVIALTSVVVGFFQRTQTGPAVVPSLHDTNR